MSKLYLIVASDVDGSSIDDNCVCYSREEVDAKYNEMAGEGSVFLVYDVVEIEVDPERLKGD